MKRERRFLSKRIWDFSDAINLGILFLGIAAVLAAPYHFTRNALWVSLVLHWVTLHLGRDPMWWVSVHRHHHQFTDSDRDPHSPVEGFWFGHINWLFHHNYLDEKVSVSPYTYFALIVLLLQLQHLQKQAYYRFLEKTYYLHLVGLALLLYTVEGLSHLIWGMVRCTNNIRVPFHIRGEFNVPYMGGKPWKTNDLSRKNWMVGLLGHGEGWHNNHHAFEFSARLGLEWWQIDAPWYDIKLLEYLGLASNVKVPTEIQKFKLSHENHNEFPQTEKLH
ncbi:hypothetical protein C5167_037441 [Papaver somniferum]|uniref:Fatty acid desaturase domain-containing protein n=1 Tax=Papaver somniferum TaxID=3469 RepID=A0A4Y7IAP2_PAPSO|nr:hypothetical protein C5167_037441 [Papaver somniferum]